MNTIRTWWRECSWYRRVLLILLALEILAFAVATAVVVNRTGLKYENTLLFPSAEGETQVYQGRLDGVPARFTVSPEGEISYQLGTLQYGPWQVAADPSAAPPGYFRAHGIEIRQGDEVLFRGCYLSGELPPLIQEDGEPYLGIDTSFLTGGGGENVIVLDESGAPIPQADYYEPGLADLARIALDPQLTHRGSVGVYLLITLLALLDAVQICFPRLFFRLSLLGLVRNRDQAEPSDFYITMEHLEWIFLAVLCLILYICNLNAFQ